MVFQDGQFRVVTFEKSVLPNEYGGCERMIESVRLFSKVANVLKVAMMAKSSNKNRRAVACITTAEY
ncbi:hypothetical protein AL051_11975 [Pseudomonas amygdali pv. dendropanacis]|nr:hypothetical protein AL051_11975 [Pseudomonas amygdali pv. dendropanacis]